MAGVVKVHGWVETDQFFGREIMQINVSRLAACPAANADGVYEWAELRDAVNAIETLVTISLVGDFAVGATEVNMIIEGHDYQDEAQVLIDLAAVTGETVTQVAF